MVVLAEPIVEAYDADKRKAVSGFSFTLAAPCHFRAVSTKLH
jgi:hypothetical protein